MVCIDNMYMPSLLFQWYIISYSRLWKFDNSSKWISEILNRNNLSVSGFIQLQHRIYDINTLNKDMQGR